LGGKEGVSLEYHRTARGHGARGSKHTSTPTEVHGNPSTVCTAASPCKEAGGKVQLWGSGALGVCNVHVAAITKGICPRVRKKVNITQEVG